MYPNMFDFAFAIRLVCFDQLCQPKDDFPAIRIVDVSTTNDHELVFFLVASVVCFLGDLP